MNNVAVRVISCGPKWTHIRYVSSNAKSRIATKKLVNDFKNNTLDIVNDSAIQDYL
ncbi:MAG: hypothetical protein ACO3M5_02370 [Saprospiraceae bacterium]|jgi:hypothetical protein